MSPESRAGQFAKASQRQPMQETPEQYSIRMIDLDSNNKSPSAQPCELSDGAIDDFLGSRNPTGALRGPLHLVRVSPVSGSVRSDGVQMELQLAEQASQPLGARAYARRSS